MVITPRLLRGDWRLIDGSRLSASATIGAEWPATGSGYSTAVTTFNAAGGGEVVFREIGPVELKGVSGAMHLHAASRDGSCSPRRSD
jgi:hypothetical protein